MKPKHGKPLIYLISDGSLNDTDFEARGGAFLKLLSDAVDCHIPLVQIREKSLSTRNLFDLACQAAAITKNSVTKLLVNERADIAAAAGTDGVHMPSNSFGPEIVRGTFGSEFLVGVSTHSIDELKTAYDGGADFAVFGPIFKTPGKSDPLGLPTLADAVTLLPHLSILALGGVDRPNYSEVLETGAAGFAAVRYLNDRSALKHLRNEFDL